jgi:hypothetical protein
LQVLRATKVAGAANMRPRHPEESFMRVCLSLLAALALALQLTACGGGSSTSSSTATAAAAKGIATPKSVSVVTAN